MIMILSLDKARWAVEILNDIEEPLDFIFGGIGGGGLMSGVAAYIKNISPNTKVIGVEPEGAPSMKAAFENGGPVHLKKLINSVTVQQFNVLDKTLMKFAANI